MHCHQGLEQGSIVWEEFISMNALNLIYWTKLAGTGGGRDDASTIGLVPGAGDRSVAAVVGQIEEPGH